MTVPTNGRPSLRLLHASDLHLERPIYGLANVPEHLVDLLIDASFRAAEQVFETALSEAVDAVLLAGDVLNVDRAGPPAIMLLLEQFARLGDRDVPIYWAGGVADSPDNWPRSVMLPDNVHIFPVGRVESHDLARGGDVVARVQGTSCREDGAVESRGFHRDAHGLFTIGVAHGTSDSAGKEGDRVHYMALGGRHKHQTVDETPGVAHYCGTPQGRGPKETGPHGCTLVHVDEAGRARPQFVATDSVRWTEQTLEVTATTKQEQLYDRLVERMEKIIAKQPGINLLVRWKVQGTGPLVNRLRPGGLSDELLTDLRRRFGQGTPLAWSVSLECDSPLSVPAEWFDQETVLGDFVREFRTMSAEGPVPFDLRPFLPEELRDDALAAIARVDGPQARIELVNRAAKLGVDLLTLPLEEGDILEDEQADAQRATHDMKISDIHIDGFGVWRDLTLRGLSPELTAFYGPNEAGKSTLMNFLRTVLYGVTPQRRQRYLPPVVGGRPGGWIKVAGDDGPFTIARYADRSIEDVGKVTTTTADGQEHGDRLLRDELEHVDEQTYINIFAVGLREVQELGTLSDTAAAQWLYRLTSGLDRVSLYDVIRMLGRSRVRMLNSAEEPSEIRTLVSRREQLQGELNELVVKGRRWAQSAVKLRELADDVDQRQAASKELAARARKLEVAINLKPLWAKREKIDDQLLRFQGLVILEDGALEALDELNHKVEEHQRQRDILRGQRQQLRDEAQRLGINDILVRNGHRLEALAEQQEWIVSLEKQVGELSDEVSKLDARLESENERLSHEWTGAGKLPPSITSEVVEQLTPQAKAIESAEHLLKVSKDELEHRRSGEHQFRSQIESAMTGGDKMGLPMTVEEANELVAMLRRRLQVEQRIEKARRQAEELQEQGQGLIDEQVVPISLFGWLLAIFVLGFAMLALWYMVPAAVLGKYGGWVAALGIGGSVFAWLFKYFVEDSAADRLEACHRQLALVAKTIHEAQDEQKVLDRELPIADGSAANRLQHAERHLEQLERMLPVESKRREAAQEITSAERRLELAKEKHAAALANWKAKLRALGLPDDLQPENLAVMAGQFELLEQLRARIDGRREDAERRQRELDAVTRRIVALADETGLRKEKLSLIAQLDHLLAEYRQQQQRVAHREGIKERAKAIKLDAIKHAQAAIGYRRKREALFNKYGVDDELGLRQLAERMEEAADLRKRRDGATREIAAGIGKHGSESDFASLLAPETIGRLENEWEALTSKLEELDKALKELLQQRGALVEQQRAAARDQSLARKQLELDSVEQQISEKCEAWRERATVGLLLDHIRDEYEQFRQPETLREASKYMAQLTSGKYSRIWTPLANDILLVDTEDGTSLPVEVLSRGTREQLFVSLRLALVAQFARRGIHLPMLLDDVFVNFDAGRTKIAVDVLREFARQGHQLLVFTCHEHVWRLFGAVKADARRIPDRYNNNEELDATPTPLPWPEPELEPEAVAALPEPEPVQVAVEEPLEELEVEEEFAPPVFEPPVEKPLLPPLVPEPVSAEVEYSWHDVPLNGKNGHHKKAVPLRLKPWPASPMIHRPDWW